MTWVAKDSRSVMELFEAHRFTVKPLCLILKDAGRSDPLVGALRWLICCSHLNAGCAGELNRRGAPAAFANC